MFMNANDFQAELVSALLKVTQEHAELLANYQELALCKELSDEAADRLDQIYAVVEHHPMLNFLLTEIDHTLNCRLGLLTEEAVKDYKDQQAWLRERLEQKPFENSHCQELQKMLAATGFYEGPIDGVLGHRSNQAFKQMTIQLQEYLSHREFYTKDIDGQFGKFTSEAVKAFLQSKSLEDSCVPNRETFSALQYD